MSELPGLDSPPLDEWSADGAVRALERFVRDLSRVDADTAFNRLMRLTDDQREWVFEQLDSMIPPDDEVGQS